MTGSEFSGVPTTIGLTGASGMVGRAILDLAGENGFKISATSRHTPINLGSHASWRRHDLCSWAEESDLDVLYPNCGALIHAGAVIPGYAGPVSRQAIIDGNVRACLNFGEWALHRKIPLVFLSGSIVYAAPHARRITEDHRCGPNSISEVYGLSKRMAEDIFADLAHQGLQVTVLRPSSIYGPGLPRGKMIWRFLESARQDKTVRLERPVNDSHNLVHARDIARACFLSLAHKKTGAFNIGADSMTTVEEIARACIEAVGCGHYEIDSAPAKRPAVSRYDLDYSAATRGFGYAPMVSLMDGIRDLWSRERLS